jgi:alkylation response protein AidB-like acyl-CoA dehydrogenase
MGIDELFIVPGQKKDDESKRVTTLVRQWADKEVIAKRLEYQQNYAALFQEKTKMLALSIGLQRMAVPSDLGGFGWNTPDHAQDLLNVLMEAGRADASVGALFAMNYALFSSVLAHGSSDGSSLLKAFSESFSSDELKVPAFILAGPGYAGEETPLFRARSILARVHSAGGASVVQGKNLRPIAAGLDADLFCIVCAGENDRQCLALVPGDAKGVIRSGPIVTTGLNAITNAEITLDNVKIPTGYLIDSPGAVENLYSWLSLLFGGVSLGAGLNFFEILKSWCEARVIKGSSLLKENPLCASVMADVAEELSLTNLLLHDLARLMALPGQSGQMSETALFTYAGMIGSRSQQAVMRAINRGLELMGSAGYAKEWHAEKHWRDVKTIQSLMCGVAAETPVKMDTARFFFSCNQI